MNATKVTRGLHRRLHFTPPVRAVIRTATCCLLVFLAYAQTASAGTVFFDNFNDGEAGDGAPVTWSPEQGTWDASSGDYVASDATELARFSTVLEHNDLSDSSVRAQVRAVGSAVVGLGLRRRPGPFGYGATISTDGSLRINRVDGRPVADSLGSASTPFNPVEEDVMLQFDAIGSELSLWVWRVGEAMPDEPQLLVIDSTYPTGAVGLVTVATENVSDSSAIYRWVHAADRRIVAPESTGKSRAGTFTFDVDAERVPPAIIRGQGKVEITWPDWLDGRQAQLEQADSVEGPWRSVPERAPYEADPTTSERQFFRVRARPVTLHIPASYEPQTPIPLVLLLHFYSGPELRGNLSAGQSQEERLGFLPLSESHGFLYAFPDGLLDAAEWQFWAANEDVADFGGMGVDDHEFLRRVIAAIQSEYNVDPKRVFLIGHLGGAIMAYEFAARHSELVAAAVALAPPVTPNALQTPPAEPVHILQINGTADTLVPFDGGSTPFNAGLGPQMLDYAAVGEVLETWAQFNGCSNWVSDPERTLDLVGEVAGADTTVSRYGTCPPGGDIELWSIQGGNNFFHAATDEFRQKVIEWLLQHPKP